MKKRILVFSSFYIPGYKGGGPIRSLENIFDHLGKNIDFYLITQNKDLGDTSSYENIPTNVWKKVGKVFVKYLDTKLLIKKIILSSIKEIKPNAIYLNSLFSFWYSFFIILIIKTSNYKNLKIILAPRGELSEGALKIKKLKKNIFIFLSKFLKIYDDVMWHASSNYEREDIIKNFGNNTLVKVAPNLVKKNFKITKPSFVNKYKSLNIIFISRISPKKNLDFAIKSLSNLNGNIRFDVYGPIENQKYYKKCLELANKMHQNIIITFKGSLNHNQVTKTIKHYDIFYLPTKGENFGQVIWESLFSGCPVLISDKTPWDNLEINKVGWVRSLDDMTSFSNILQSICDNKKDFIINRENVQKYSLLIANSKANILANKEIFLD